ncbi:unnamed protein product [Fraxinus pennsylvanica]|uniref:F-box associated domain-containing protein n=1 Tax=Fraxinus pennsylvanica TaxID=56036 RepID=A0AAD2AE54_9LAMI|nr:unnamed protein product [Fraxinus pennsylvanica]
MDTKSVARKGGRQNQNNLQWLNLDRKSNEERRISCHESSDSGIVKIPLGTQSSPHHESYGFEPVFAMGALHWLPLLNHNEYIVLLLVDDEKFMKISLPKSGEINDRIIAMSGFLGFVTRHEDVNRLDVWILRGLGYEVWEKRYSIRMDCTMNMVPLYCSRIDGEIIFRKNYYDLYAYDCSLQIKVEVKKGSFPFNGCYLPHVNSLISWMIPVKM